MSLQALVQKLPGVASPVHRLSFKEKLKWTGIILFLYYVLASISVYGIDPQALIRFEQLEMLMGASMGSIITLGIGPIVSASIILQLMVGSKIINWDLSTHDGKILFQGTQKLLAFGFALVEAIAYTLMGAVRPVSFDPFTVGLVIFQLALGGWIIIFMDEVVSKWGFGSGVGIFIVAGVSKQIAIKAFSPIMSDTGFYAGAIPRLLQGMSQGSFETMDILALGSTLFVFLLVVYAQAMRVEIPLAFGSLRGFGRKWPLKFIYTSNIPVILTAALLINFQIWAKLLASKGITILGTFQGEVPVSGLVHYLDPPRMFIYNLINFNIMGDEVLRVIIYSAFMILGSVLFSIFWVNTSNMDAGNVARQIQQSGMQIPGFRRDVRVIESILNRYIPYLAVLGGAFVGFLAALADFTGALAGGTGILLAVMITYQLYEQIAMQHMEDMHPALRKMMEK